MAAPVTDIWADEAWKQTPSRTAVLLSGGLDSAVLADTLGRTATEHGKALLAVHVDHVRVLRPQFL